MCPLCKFCFRGGLQEGDDHQDRLGLNNNHNNFQPKKLENLEGRILIPFPRFGVGDDDDHHQVLKQESSKSLSFLWNEKESSSSSSSAAKAYSQTRPATCCSSPKSSVNSNGILDFSFNKVDSKNQIYSSEVRKRMYF